MPDSRPLTHAQQAMVIDSMNSPDSGLWNVQLTFRIPERLDVERLRDSWQRVLDRHTALRSRVVLKGQPSQHVDEDVAFSWEIVDWTDRPEETLQESVDALRREMLLTDHDFSVAPVQRVALVTCREDLHYCIWVGHHAFVDGRSMYNLASEVGTLYRGRELEPARPFVDYLDWRSDHLASGSTFWKELLGGFDKPTGLGWEDDGRSVGHLGGTELRLSRADTEKLTSYCEGAGVSLNALVQGAWGLLVHRYSGSDDVVFGSVRACRKSAIEKMDAMIGQFVNAVPVRLRVTPELTVKALVEEVRRQHLAVRDVEHTSPLEIRAASALPIGPRLFETVVAFERLSIRDAIERGGQLGGWEVVDRGRNGYATTVFAYGGPEMLLRMEWHGGWLPDATAERVLPNLAHTMLEMVEKPDVPVTRIDCLTPRESERLLVEWQGPVVDYPRGETLHGCIEEQARRTPGAVAVTFASQQQTYTELMDRAAQVAATLRARGVDRGSRVGVWLPRCLDLPAVLVGIMKAGGAYVPLDPDDPTDRIRFLLDETSAKAVVTTPDLAEDAGLSSDVVVLLDDVDAVTPEPDATWPPVSDEDHAYVIFTSGSTGQPKGVINAHRGVVNRLKWAQDTYALTAEDRVLQKTPYTFDVSVWEFFWPLMTGARLVVAEPDGHKDMRYLADVIESEGITLMHFVPSVLREFLEEVEPARCATLRQVICSGEAVPVDVKDDFLERMGAELDNLYGPTEAAIDVSRWRCRHEAGQSIVPMGTPVANTQLRVLGPHMQLTPIGVTGELFIGGVQVAVGYENRPELTDERFLPDPFEPGSRLYRTGDLVRHREDGALEFLGRMDDQVKVRGFRIELGEIEAALRKHPAVRDAAVIARKAPGEPARLIAFVIHEGAEVPMASELRQYLREWLPSHMIPGLFHDVTDFPRLSSGKIDRKALARRAEEYVTPTRGVDAPLSSDVERVVAEAWVKLLPVGHVGAEDNFFELGGDSLLAMQAVLAIEDAVGYRLDPRMMFFKNLRQIALAVEEATGSAADDGAEESA